MIWLASFPRSGNTFLRNILFEVYGLESSTFHLESNYPLDSNFSSYPFVKTHELPSTLPLQELPPDSPAVYLVRDGRDAICSIAHHRTDLIMPGSDYHQNIREAIIADRGSFFGGWSINAEQWLLKADLIIRYEDLIQNPVETVERLRQLYELPEPDISKLPTFEAMKFSVPQYGAGRHQDITENKKLENSRAFFRKGEAGAWKYDMPTELQDLFWSYHGETMAKLGYSKGGDIQPPHPDLDGPLSIKLGYAPPKMEKRKYRVLIESNKLVSPDNDGVKRYQVELLRALYPVVENPFSKWQVDVYEHGHIHPLKEFKQTIFQDFLTTDRQKTPQGLRRRLVRLEAAVMAMVPRRFVRFLQSRNITAFHDIYELFKAAAVNTGLHAATGLARLRTWPKRLAGVFPGGVANPDKNDVEMDHSYDLIHLPLMQNFVPFENSDTRKVITIHDLTHHQFPEYHTAMNIRNAERGMRYAADSGSHLIAISESTKTDILNEGAVPEENIHVIYEAADPLKFNFKMNKSDCRQVREKYGIAFGEPYIICLSTLEPRKNLENSIKSFISLCDDDPGIGLKLVIAGKKGWDAAGIFQLAAKHPNHIFFTGFVDDADLAYLYSDALALSYLSFYEGFGLPPLEAMRCGTPVVYGNNSSMIEVIGKAGLPADPHDVEDIKAQYLQVYRDPQLRTAMSQFAIAQAVNFSWRETAIKTLDLYEKVITEVI